MNIVSAPGKDDRLTLDTSVNNVNPGVHVEEKVFLPTIRDANDASSDPSPTGEQESPDVEWIGFSLDVRKAHKRIKVAVEDQGLLLFAILGELFFYKVCHFGGAFSAYWWARVGALLIRLAHRLVYVCHTGFLYVDDFLWKFRKEAAPLLSVLVLALLVGVGCPLSWAKMRLAEVITWIGLTIQFHLGRWVLLEDKLLKVRVFLHQLASCHKHAERKSLEAGTGLLLWVSNIVPVLRPWLAEFFQALVSETGTLVSLGNLQLAELLDSINDTCTVTLSLRSVPVHAGWRLLQVGNRRLASKKEA